MTSGSAFGVVAGTVVEVGGAGGRGHGRNAIPVGTSPTETVPVTVVVKVLTMLTEFDPMLVT